jgi:hypothetical protein
MDGHDKPITPPGLRWLPLITSAAIDSSSRPVSSPLSIPLRWRLLAPKAPSLARDAQPILRQAWKTKRQHCHGVGLLREQLERGCQHLPTSEKDRVVKATKSLSHAFNEVCMKVKRAPKLLTDYNV